MVSPVPRPLRVESEDAVLLDLLETTASETGPPFFRALVRGLVEALGVGGAWVTEYVLETRRLRSLTFLMCGQWIEDGEYDLAGTPCEQVVDRGCMMHVPDQLQAVFPGDPDLARLGILSYMGVPLFDVDGATVLGSWPRGNAPTPGSPKVSWRNTRTAAPLPRRRRCRASNCTASALHGDPARRQRAAGGGARVPARGIGSRRRV